MSPHDPSEHGSSGSGGSRNSTIAHRVHDLNNLLTVMAGSVDSLTTQLSDLAALSDLADLQYALGRAFLLATELLGSEAALSTERSAVDINHAIVEIEGMVRRVLGPTIGCKLNLLAKAPFVFAHPLDIERILINLILNAREAMGDHGLLTIATTSGPISTGVPTGPSLPRDFVRLTISDTGIGFAEGPDASVTREPSFTATPRRRGLGLGSVHEIVHLLGGCLHMEPEGIGTRVHVDLPLAAQRLQAQP